MKFKSIAFYAFSFLVILEARWPAVAQSVRPPPQSQWDQGTAAMAGFLHRPGSAGSRLLNLRDIPSPACAILDGRTLQGAPESGGRREGAAVQDGGTRGARAGLTRATRLSPKCAELAEKAQAEIPKIKLQRNAIDFATKNQR
jgi:hypothetical protein